MNVFDWLLAFLIWMSLIYLLWKVFDMAHLPSGIYSEYPKLETEEEKQT